MNDKIPKVCGICGVELDFSRRELQKIQMLMKQSLAGWHWISVEKTLEVFHPIAHKLHTERKK